MTVHEGLPAPETAQLPAPIRRRRRLGRAPETLRDHPGREIATGLAVIGAFAAIFLGWAAFARLDAAVYAPGVVVVSGNRQTVQHRDGGLVGDLPVREGDRVRAGQVLLTLVADELRSNARATGNQVIEQQALQARLTAELHGAKSVAAPAAFAGLTGEDRAAADSALTLNRLEFARRAEALASERAVLANQADQGAEQIKGIAEQVKSNREQQRLIKEEIAGLGTLVDRGLVPLTRLRTLQRTQADLQGAEGADTAGIARNRQEIGEKRIRTEDLARQRDAEDAKDYRLADAQLADLQPKLAALREQIGRTVVRAPATGRVVGLSIFTVGGVVSPGQKLMDVVPEDQPLVLEARVKPADAEDLRPGQMTEIKISAFKDRSMPLLHGRVDRVSADSLNDEKTGVSYFKVQVTVPPSELAVIRNVRGAEAGLRPGLPVEVVVPLHARTALDYLVEPLRHMLWKSFREH